jgi:starch synthase (maltosyl-transferring)
MMKESPAMPVPRSRARVVIENVQPEIDAGRFPIKRVVGEQLEVEADVFSDGHEEISVALLHRHENNPNWTSVPMQSLGNDHWAAHFAVTQLGFYRWTIRGWVDPFKSWRRDLGKRLQAGQDVTLDMQIGADLLSQAAARAPRVDANTLRAAAKFVAGAAPVEERTRKALEEDISRLASLHADLRHAATHERELEVWVDRERARFSGWYELFPRSCSPESGKHGTFRDVAARVPQIASMGFDVLYLPPIHPIGKSFRKGKNNVVSSTFSDVGSPWGIGGQEGGHKATHPQLGTLEDFKFLLGRTRDHGMEIALDIAFQCSPDHPWVKEHPEWFRKRPDGTIQYAENPPKKYQDIFPLDFETEKWNELWDELKSVFLFWIDQGVRIFRVDNPHTKAFGFWEWCIGEIRSAYPDVLFLAEAFTRPKVMYRLAKLGFTQSYTYFTWRNSKQELTDYFTELTRTKVREFFRPNLWPNTPDILHAYLQNGGRPAFIARLILAATLGASYGMYGPAFELCVSSPKEAGSEEYLNSEKYEIKQWDLDSPISLRPLITLVNRIRRENAALQSNDSLIFHWTDNENLLCYSKHTPARDDIVLTVVNLDPYRRQSGWTGLLLDQLGMGWHDAYTVHDLLTENRYLWHGARNYIELNPHVLPAHVFLIRR